jgi:hypothetical protein
MVIDGRCTGERGTERRIVLLGSVYNEGLREDVCKGKGRDGGLYGAGLRLDRS